MTGMTREELLKLRDKILLGDPPYEVDSVRAKMRRGGIPGLEERRSLGDYDVSASGVRMALEAILQLTQDRLDRMRKP